MILDTTYLLPLVGIAVKADLLKAIVEGRIKKRISLYELKINLISLFELQAKASKLNIPSERVNKAVNIIVRSFHVTPFYQQDIIKYSFELHKIISDYIDCVVVATAIAFGDELVTEDSIILSVKEEVEKKYGVSIYSYRDLVE